MRLAETYLANGRFLSIGLRAGDEGAGEDQRNELQPRTEWSLIAYPNA